MCHHWQTAAPWHPHPDPQGCSWGQDDGEDGLAGEGGRSGGLGVLVHARLPILSQAGSHPCHRAWTSPQIFMFPVRIPAQALLRETATVRLQSPTLLPLSSVWWLLVQGSSTGLARLTQGKLCQSDPRGSLQHTARARGAARGGKSQHSHQELPLGWRVGVVWLRHLSGTAAFPRSGSHVV